MCDSKRIHVPRKHVPLSAGAMRQYVMSDFQFTAEGMKEEAAAGPDCLRQRLRQSSGRLAQSILRGKHLPGSPVTVPLSS